MRLLSVTLVIAMIAAPAAAQDRAADEAAVRARLAAGVEAINRRDAVAWAALFTPDADVIVLDGPRADGRPAIQELAAAAWTAAPDERATIAPTAATQAAENAGSVEGMRLNFAGDLIMLAPNMPAVVGPEAVAQAMQQYFDAFSLDVTYTSEEVFVVGDWGFDRGTYRNTLTPRAGGAPIADTGKYLWIYRRQQDGSWKQSRVMWNSSEPSLQRYWRLSGGWPRSTASALR